MPTTITPYRLTNFQKSTYTDSRFPGVQDFSTYVTSLLVGNDTVVRNSNPDWKKKVARREDASTAYSRVSWNVKSGVHSCSTFLIQTPSVYWAQVGTNVQVQFLAHDYMPNGSDPTVSDIALSRLKNRLNSEVGNMNAMAPVAELRELHSTMNALRNFTADTIKLVLAVKKKRGKRAAKIVSKMWLTYSFGVKPLLADIKKADDAISDFLLRQDKTVKLHGSASKKFTQFVKITNVTGALGAPMTYVIRYECEISYRYVGGFDLNVKSNNNYGVVDHFGLSLRNVPSTLYELTAFSWMLDYFTTTGAYLEDVFAVPPGTLKYLVQNQRFKVSMVQSGSFSAAPGYLITSQSNANGGGDYFSFSRTPLTSIPTRALRIKTLDEIGRNANNRLLNLLSLLGGSLSDANPRRR